MRLKKLELVGFKSFADKTEIFFDEGVTCVVGPNGCGKSNISDSIRWVLGERSAKMLRGSKMEDIIFNGTDFRKPLNMAEVSLTIDNTDRGLAIEYNEVTITRRLFRSGESEYLLNKTVCRLKDIQDLILDTGIGSNSYSMIEQGRIDYILNADADERRFLIEEAAGISKFKVKKEEAIRKLERTEENRLRLNDIVHEVHKNIQYAERQARRAERYKEEFEKLKKFEIQKAFYDLTLLHQEKETLQHQKEAVQTEAQNAERKIAEIRKSQETLNETLREITNRYQKAESERYAILSKFDQNQQQIKFNQEKKLEMANRQGQIEQELEQLRARIEKACEEITSKKDEIIAISTQRDGALEELKNSQDRMKEIENKLEETKKQLDGFKTQAFQTASEASRIRNEYHRILAFLESVQQQRQKQDAGANRLHDEAKSWQTKKSVTESDALTLIQKIQTLSEQDYQLNEKINAQTAFINQLKAEEDHLEKTLHEKETRLELLKEIEAAAKASEEELLDSTDGFQRDLVHSLRQVFSVQPGYEWALEAALDSFSKSLVADDLATAEIILNRIRDKKASATGVFIRSSAAPTTQISEVLEHPKIQCALADVVKILPGFENLFTGFIHNTYVVEDLSSSELLHNFHSVSAFNRFLSPNGVILGFDQRIFFRHPHNTSEQNSFKRSAETDGLINEISRLNETLSQKHQTLEATEHTLLENQNLLEVIEAELLQSKVQKESLESTRQGVEERLVSYEREIQLLDFETKELLSQQEEALTKKQSFEQDLHRLEEEEQKIRHYQDSLAQDMNEIDHQRASSLQHFAEQKALFSHIEERSKLLEESVKIMEDHQSRNEQRVKDLAHESELLLQRQRQISQENTELEQEQNRLQDSRREADIAVELIRQEKEKNEAVFAELQEAFLTSSQNLQELQGSVHQFEMKFMDLGYQEKNITDRLQQTYRLNLSELKSEEFSLDAEQAAEMMEKIEELKKKVEGLGTVNLLAIEEYEELKQRYEFLMTQQKDLDDAKEQLMETIRKINRTTKGLFEETFHSVQKTFQEYYQTLFRGGHAQLVLLDESNPLESGIDIVVRPPGKKPQHITLLSGGEKALTAIALLFALFKIKPSPFCVLDEVDAPLDEANVDRFLNVLRSFLTMSQFIIVTHNRKTIAMGDSLYGVTMQEAGVSKLVSVKVSKDASSPSPVQTIEGSPAKPEQINV